MSALERKKDVLQEVREKGLKTYLVCIHSALYNHFTGVLL